MSELTIKDLVYAIGILLTFAMGVANLVSNYRNAKTTRFINTVTNQRVQWIEQLRQDISAYSSAVALLGFGQAGAGDADNVLEQAYRLVRAIRLRLNPNSGIDQEIESLLNEITQELQGGGAQASRLSALLERLTTSAQLLLKAEWEKVKSEAEHGRLAADRGKAHTS